MMPCVHHATVDDQRFGAVIRAVRSRRGWRQADLGACSGLSRSAISRMERGHLDTMSIRSVRLVAAALDVRVEVLARWRAGDLDRLVNARHSALHESVARFFRELAGWEVVAEVSFSVYGERGVIDLLAWHAPSRTLLIIELKTDIVDVQELIGTLDRKRRHAATIARERGWDPRRVACWVIVAEGRTNRRRVQAHASVLRLAFPQDGRQMNAWLRAPVDRMAALSFWSELRPGNVRGGLATRRRVRKTAEAAPRAQTRASRGSPPTV